MSGDVGLARRNPPSLDGLRLDAWYIRSVHLFLGIRERPQVLKPMHKRKGETFAKPSSSL